MSITVTSLNRGTLTVAVVTPQSADTAAPTMTAFAVTNPSGQTVRVTFDSDEQLGTDAAAVAVAITRRGDGRARPRRLHRQRGRAVHLHRRLRRARTAPTPPRCNAAEDAAGNDGAAGETDSVVIDTTAPSVPPGSPSKSATGN